MSVRDSFEQQFGVDLADRVVMAANEHANGVNDTNRGSDPFKWALLICIGYECLSHPEYREYHRMELDWPIVKQWIVEEGNLASHDGDFDYVSLFTGDYNEYVGRDSGAEAE